MGSHVAERLLEAGHQVVALQRPSSNTGFLRAIGCTVAGGDVREGPKALANHMGDCRWMVHCAAVVYSGTEWPSVRAVNVDGTRNVLEGAALAGVEHAVHVSSVAVYGQVAGERDEDAPLDGLLRPRDLYARSKRMAEEEAVKVHRSGRLSVTRVRPSVVYGERDRLFTPRLARLLRSPIVPILGSGDNTVPVVYAGNVAAGVEAALSGKGSGNAFNLAEDFALTQRQILQGLAKGLGRTPRLVSLPSDLIRGAARLADTLGLSVPGSEGLAPSRVARLALQDNPYRSERARDILGWRPPYRHEEGLRRTGEWLTGRTTAR